MNNETTHIRIRKPSLTESQVIGVLTLGERLSALVIAGLDKQAHLTSVLTSVQPDTIPLTQRPEQAAWDFLISQWNTGLFSVKRDGATYVVHFQDGDERIPLRELAYDSEIGAHRRLEETPHGE